MFEYDIDGKWCERFVVGELYLKLFEEEFVLELLRV